MAAYSFGAKPPYYALGTVTPQPQAATPTSFAAGTPTATSVPLSWQGPAGATYVVQRATNAGFTTGLTTIYTGTNTSVTNSSGLSAATAYYYRVKAQVSGYTDSAYASLSVTTAASAVAATLHDRLKDSQGGYVGDAWFEGQEATGPDQVGSDWVMDYTCAKGHSTGNDNTNFTDYGQGDDTQSFIGRRRASTLAGLKTAPIINMIGEGYGGIARAAMGGTKLTANGFDYFYTTNGYSVDSVKDRQLYLAKAVAGQDTWTDLGKILDFNSFPGSLQGFGNTCVIPDPATGGYLMFAEIAGAGNIWRNHRVYAPAPEGPWGITHRLDSLDIDGNMFGGPSVWRDEQDPNLLHMLYHYGAGVVSGLNIGPNLPTYGAYSRSYDNGITWEIVEAPFRTLESLPFGPPVSVESGTTQQADFVPSNTENPVIITYSCVQNSVPTRGQLRFLTFPGTRAQMVAGLLPCQPTADDLTYLDYRVLVGCAFRYQSRLLREFAEKNDWGLSYGIGRDVCPIVSNPPAGKTKLVLRWELQYPYASGTAYSCMGLSPAGTVSIPHINNIKWGIRPDASGGIYPTENGGLRGGGQYDYETFHRTELRIEIPLATMKPEFYIAGQLAYTSTVAVTTDLEVVTSLTNRERLWDVKKPYFV